MNWAHIHLMINHFPVIGLMLVALLLLSALLRKSEELKKTSLAAFVLIALITIPVYLTGEGAENIAKKLPGVTEAFIGRHEEAASVALVLILLQGAVSLGGLIFYRRSAAFPKWFMAVVLVMSIITAAAAGLTANIGGQIRHTEIRKEGKPAQSSVLKKQKGLKRSDRTKH